jgi:GTPase SAR1 family protein
VECELLFMENYLDEVVIAFESDLSYVTFQDNVKIAELDCVVVVFSVTENSSLKEAEEILQKLWQSGHLNTKTVIIVGNKTDLVRTREVPIDGNYLYSSQGNESHSEFFEVCTKS